jgi:NDP-sugar pyrophosphorylase family protein
MSLEIISIIIYFIYKKMKPTLLILAAGMGSRYGGLKQIDAVGPSGEAIMDYSVYDAVRAGFGKVVFVIRKDFEADFRKMFGSRFGNSIEVDFVFQSTADVPQGSTYNKERTKPWGTNHALLMAADAINEPFAVINADDFYGKDSYVVLAQFLQGVAGKTNDYCLVAYRLGNTLSKYGSVARGICQQDASGNLQTVEEFTGVSECGGQATARKGDDKEVIFPLDTPVSMNMWGFTPDYFAHSEQYFKKFLEQNGDNLKAEFFIPLMVDHLIKNRISTVKMLTTSAQWFGMTYQEDKSAVQQEIRNLIDAGVYPSQLWK